MAFDEDIDAPDESLGLQFLRRPGIPGQPTGPPSAPAGESAQQSEQPPRLSIGQRIAGVKDQPAPTPVASNQPPKPPFDPNLLPPLVRRPGPVTPPNMVPAPPTLAQDRDFAALAKRQGELATPLSPYDPATKQIKPEYRMGMGQRILGSLANAASGFGGDRGAPVRVGPGATNWRFGREEAARQGQLEGVNTQIKTQEQMAAENEKIFRDALRQSYEGQRGEAALETAQARKETADARKEAEDLKRDQGPKNKVADDYEERKKIADEMRLQGEERKSYLATGKLPGQDRPPKQPSELELWMDAFKRDNNRPPTAEEIANRKSRGASKADSIEKDKDTQLQKAEEEAQKQLGKLDMMAFTKDLSKPRGESMQAWQARRKQEVYADLEKKKGQIQGEYETRARQNAAQDRGPAANSAKSANKPRPETGKPIMVKDKDGVTRMHNVVGWNDKTNKPIVDPTPVSGQ